MSKGVNFTLAVFPNVDLKCDGKLVECRYKKIKGKRYGEWHVNGENTGLQVTGLITHLREKYIKISVIRAS